MLRRLVKSCAASLLHATQLDRVLGRWSGDGTPLVLGYHRVVDDFPAYERGTIPAMLISRDMLDHHLDWLGRRYRFVSLDELGAQLASGRPFAEPVAAITFDDGYRDMYDYAYPVLRARRVPAAIFIATDFVDRQIPLAHDCLFRLASLALVHDAGLVLLNSVLHQKVPAIKRPEPERTALAASITTELLGRLPRTTLTQLLRQLETEMHVKSGGFISGEPLTWNMLAEMQRGGITVGVHTKTHSVLTNESAGTVLSEVRRSRQLIEQRLGTRAEHFAYPDGRFNRGVVRAVARAGIRFAYTTCAHRDPEFPLLTIPRRLLWEQSCVDSFDRFSPAIMSSHAHGLLDVMNTCANNHEVDYVLRERVAREHNPYAAASGL